MNQKVCRFVAWVLLALLPLQATAVAAMTCSHAKSTTAVAAVFEPAAALTMDDCPHSRAVAADDQRSDRDRSGDSQQGDQNPQSCCSAISACAMCTAAASTQQWFNIGRTLQKTDSFLASQFTSFIPEGLLRPPSVLA